MANKSKETKGLKLFFKSFSTKQIVWFVIGAVLFVTGFVFDVLDIIGRSINVAPSKNSLLLGDAKLKEFFGNKPLGFTFWGIVLLLVGAIIISITFSLASKNEDRDKERQARKEQRLKKMVEVQNKVIESSTISEAPVVSTVVQEDKK